MSLWNLFQICFDFLILAAGAFVWVRLNKPAKDDPRLSKGLQILQTKISILEDLSDRTENQVSQLTAILENKCKSLRQIIEESEKQILKIEKAKEKSLEVAKIFQDKIPHNEILERQSMIKYVKAAKLAHQGKDVDEIAKAVDLSRGELEFIAKVNKEQLMFSEAQLPDWIHSEMEINHSNAHFPISNHGFTKLSGTSIQVREGSVAESIPISAQQILQPQAQAKIQVQIQPQLQPQLPPQPFPEVSVSPNSSNIGQTSTGKTPHIRPFEFPRITMDRTR